MARVACPYCYERIENTALAFQCVGRGAAGRTGCRRVEDPVRREATGFAGFTFPTFPAPGRRPLRRTRADCPRCGGTTGARACPSCHSPLPTTFAGSRSPLVGMVGGKGAGKTVYLTVLHQQLQTAVRRRFDADVRLVGDQQGGETTTEGFLATYRRALFDDGQLFEATRAAEDSRKEPLVIEWRQPHRSLGRSGLRTTILSFYDTAGEDLTSQESVHTQTYLGVADGMIVLLDPWQLPGVRDRLTVPAAAVTGAERPLDVLERVTELLRASHGVRAHRPVEVPVAVAFAKVDALFGVLGRSDPLFAPVRPVAGYDEEAGQSVHEYVTALLARFDADDVDAHLRLNYRHFRYFAVSALGAEPDYEGTQVDPGGVQPFRVEEPLLWLLHRLGVVARSRA
jgi:hypothetical protein